ncbi:MAG: hypothetical protein ACE5KM_24230 [Planctomycetaceae bacterium]
MHDLTRAGIHLEAHGDRLRFHPRSAMTPDLIDRIKAHKNELLAILRPDDDPDAPQTVPVIVNTTAYDKYDRPIEAFTGKRQSGQSPSQLRCRCHEEQRWWRSVFGPHVICGVCHPPATPGVVLEWLQCDTGCE